MSVGNVQPQILYFCKKPNFSGEEQILAPVPHPCHNAPTAF